MCFNQTMSGLFAAMGLGMAWWLRKQSRFRGTRCAEGVFYFFLMEFLQYIQYFFIANDLADERCQDIINKVLTVLGFAHICLQPYYTHVLNSSMTLDPKNPAHQQLIEAEAKPRKDQDAKEALAAYKHSLELKHAKFSVILKLCLIGGFLLFARFLLAYVPSLNTMDFSGDVKASQIKPMVGNQLASTEWLRGGKICTWKGNYHLAWSMPMADPTYNIMGAGIHSFLMFAPFLAVVDKFNKSWILMFIQAAFLWALGPGLASLVSPNLHEQASIWCFFSIAQIFVMIFGIFTVFNKAPKKEKSKQ